MRGSGWEQGLGRDPGALCRLPALGGALSVLLFLIPSMEEKGKQPLHSPTRDPHLSWAGGISSIPSASSLPACPHGLSVDVLLAPAGS